MKGPFEADDDATPITPAEREALIPTHVTLRSELNELEQQNIVEANAWAFERKRNVLDEVFLLGLHRRTFNNVWRWAGEYRKTERTRRLPHLIQPELLQAINDARYCVDHKSYEPDELAVRFHHKAALVPSISKWKWGRWSRLAADLLVTGLGGTRFSWGGASSFEREGEARRAYIDASREAA